MDNGRATGLPPARNQPPLLSDPYASTAHYTSTPGSYAIFSFNGTGFTLTYTANTNRSTMDIYVDGTKVATLNEYNASLLRQRQWTSPAFAAGVHTVTFVHAASMDYYVDAITETKTSEVSPSEV